MMETDMEIDIVESTKPFNKIYIFKDIIIMSADLINSFRALPPTFNKNTIVFVSSPQKFYKPENIPRELNSIDGFLYLLNGRIINMNGNIQKILQVLLCWLEFNNIFITLLPNQEWIIEILIQFGIKNIVVDGLSLELTLNKSVPLQEILVPYRNIRLAKETGECELDCLFTPSLAYVLSPLVNTENIEVSGKIFIQNYTTTNYTANQAVLAFHTDFLMRGDCESSPLANGPLSFHTHPDICYADNRCYIGWPSGQDMYMMVFNFLQNRNILAHFVVSSEGIWIMHIAVPFQRILYNMKKTINDPCRNILLKTFRDKFALLDSGRSYYTVEPINRSSSKNKFIDFVNNYKISTLLNEFPKIKDSCKTVIKKSDWVSSLLNVNIIEWENLKHGPFPLRFRYLLDPAGGFTPYFPPNFGKDIINQFGKNVTN